MFRKFPTKKRHFFTNRGRNPEAALKAAVKKITAILNNLFRAERYKIRYDRKILVFENERWKIAGMLQQQEKKLMQKTQSVQALEGVRKSMQIAIRKIDELKSIAEEENVFLTELNKCIEKLEREIDILGKIRFSSLRLKKKSSEMLTEMRSIISRTEEVIERIKVTATENEELREKFIILATKAKDITKTYY